MLDLPAYAIEKRLARGATGTVYLAHQSASNRPLALRVLHPWLAPAVRENLLADARAVGECFHPHLAEIHQVGEAGEHQYLAMEWLPGGSLRQRLAEGFEPARAVPVIRGLAAALGYLHCRGRVHRDLRPRNILFRADATPVLGDVSSLALPVGGAHRYLSPEQRAGQPLDQRSDLYALGLVFLEMLGGQIPEGGNPPQAILPTPWQDLAPVLERLLAVDPEDRYDCAEAFIRDLDQHVDWQPAPTWPLADHPPGQGVSSARRRLPVWLLPSAGVTLGLLAAAAVNLHLLLGQYPGISLDISLNWFAGSAPPALQTVPGIPLAARRRLTASPLLDASPVTPATPTTAITGRQPDTDGGWSVRMLSDTDPTPGNRLGAVFQPRLAAASVRAMPGLGATLNDDRQPLLARLLATAEDQYRSLKLTTPRGDNAYETYQSMLRVDPANAEAQAGLKAITARYLAWAERAWRQGSYRDSLDRIERGLTVDPDHGGLLALRKQVRQRWQQSLEGTLAEPAPAPTPRRVRIPGGPFADSSETPAQVVSPRPDLWNRSSR